MTHFKTCICKDPQPNHSGRFCTKCEGYIPPEDFKKVGVFVPGAEGNHLVQSDPDEEPVRGTFQWSEEDPEDVKAYTSLAEVLMKVKDGNKLYMEDPLFHKIIDMIVFYKKDPIQAIADLTMKFTSFRKDTEDYINRKLILINKDEIKTDKN
ncbi:hypothetical protein LCGC14_0938300 [marine sediment metagenome]|uniref:Uncharacterized protein n=1 Tax=marine sediment metagenome TaxID=412755 RepID=A0A0F9R4F1_9ZZZZ